MVNKGNHPLLWPNISGLWTIIICPELWSLWSLWIINIHTYCTYDIIYLYDINDEWSFIRSLWIIWICVNYHIALIWNVRLAMGMFPRYFHHDYSEGEQASVATSFTQIIWILRIAIFILMKKSDRRSQTAPTAFSATPLSQLTGWCLQAAVLTEQCLKRLFMII